MDIYFSHVYKAFGLQPVLRDLNLNLPEGSTTCIMGPSGSGKTTLLNLLLGLLSPDSGSISGLENKRIAAVFQENRLCETLDAADNLRLVCGKTLSNTLLAQSFQEIGLTGALGKPVAELSGGMKRRVAILRALLADSNFILLDEPFKGLDDTLKQQVISYICRKAEGKTLLLVTHDPSEAKAMNAEIIELQKLQECITIRETR